MSRPKPLKLLGTVYLLHFTPPYKHCRHYVGFVEGGPAAVRERLTQHLKGQGARLVQVVVAAGCQVAVSKVWCQQPRGFERALKKRHHGPLEQFCAICKMKRRA